MKILHALVGYLAATALPFCPFAFAYPLAAIDYDGYVNTTQNNIDGALMKHLLGSIVETCQTVTTKNHSDIALMKRVPGDIIEARQLSAPAVVLIISIVVVIGLSVYWISGDDPVRGNDVEFLVDHFDYKSSARNVRRLLKLLSAR